MAVARPAIPEARAAGGPGSPASGERRAALARLVPAALLLALWLAVVPSSGGYFPSAWYPATLATLGLLCACWIAYGRIAPSSRPARAALACLAGLVAWALLSMTWAGSPADAWATGDQLVLALAVAAIAAVIPWTPTALCLVAGAWSLGVAVLCAGRLVTWLGAENLLTFFTPDGRLYDPIGYPNATAALPALALFPALALGSVRTMPIAVRALTLPVATFLAGFAVLPQSRGAVLGMAAGVVVLLIAVPDRLRLLARLVVVVGLTAAAASALVGFGGAVEDGRAPGPALDSAAAWLVSAAVISLLLGVALAMVEARVSVPRPRPGRTQVRVAVAVVALACVAAVAVLGPRAADWARDTWRARTTPDAASSSRLLSLSPWERPDYARVALRSLREHPVGGLGAGNFGREYDAQRHLAKHSRYPHNIFLRAASEGGAVGLVLLLGLIGCLAWGLAAMWRRAGPAGRGAAAAAAAMGTYFCVHGSLDWLEQFPALVAPTLGLAFGAAALAPAVRTRPERARWMRAAGIAAAAAAIVAALVALVPPYVSDRYVARARDTWTTAPTPAFDDLDRAARWNPWSADPRLNQGMLALELGQEKRAARSFRRALAREETWFPYFQLAAIEARAGRFPNARRMLDRAAALDAVDPLIVYLSDLIDHRQRPSTVGISSKALDTPLFRQAQVP